MRLAEEERIRKEKEKDYLAPFAARIGDPVTFDRKQIEEVSQVSIENSVAGESETLQCMCFVKINDFIVILHLLYIIIPAWTFVNLISNVPSCVDN